MKLYGLKDEPIVNDEDEALGLSDYADALSKFIKQCDTPMTIAIQGDWGSGKTSLMNIIKGRLEKEKRTILKTIWFNTWQYSQFNQSDSIPVFMLSHMAEELAGDAGKKDFSTIKNVLLKAAKTTAIAAGSLMGQGDLVKDVCSSLQEDAAVDPATAIKSLKQRMEKMVANVIKDNKSGKIVIFIDDLDRLVPARAVELLEVIKLFIDLNGCVFVLACDYQVVVQGLIQKLGVTEGELKGKSFFDKIIQVPFNMPIHSYQVEKYFEKLLEDLNIKFRKADLPIYVDLINYSVGFNPRSMKRVFNSMLLLLHVLESRKKADEQDTVARDYEWTRILFGTLCMQNSYPAFFKYLNKMDITDELFLSLRNIQIVQEDDRFNRLRKELKFSEDDELLERFVAFVETFYRALQLKNDTDKNKLSDDEIKTLKYVLSSSSIVSTESSEKTASITREQFIELLDETGRNAYRHVFEFLDCHEKDLVLNWGSKGFSVNVKIDGGIVCLFYGYLSNSPYKQCIYTEFNQIAKKVKHSEPIVEYYKNEISGLSCFIDAGTNKKWILNAPIVEDDLMKFLIITGNLLSMIKGEMNVPVLENSQKSEEQNNVECPEEILIAAT